MEITDLVLNVRAEAQRMLDQHRALMGAADLLEAVYGLTPKAQSVDAKPVQRRKHPVKAAIAKKDGKTPDAKKPESKECHKCGAVKTLDDFPAHKDCKDGHTGTCKACTRKRVNASKQKPTQPDATASGIVCKLCHAPCSSADRLASYMRAVHSMAAA